MEFDSSPQAITWFRDRYLDGSLDIRPAYQRRPVWGTKQKCALIESILLALPVPELYMQQTTSEEGVTTYAVVDGQQRTRTVLQFMGAEQDEGEVEFNRFALDRLPAESPWYGMTIDDLDADDRRRFYNYRLAIRNLHTDRDDEVRSMFKRLNQYQTPLNPQELRNAIFTGPFVVLASDLAEDPYWSEHRIVTPAGIRRMADIQLVSELLIGLLHGPQGGSPKSIDAYYEQYEEYDIEFPEQKRVTDLYAGTMAVIEDLFPQIRTTRWSNLTDFYSLFVALGHVVWAMDPRFTARRLRALREALTSFEEQVEGKQANENLKVPQRVSRYVRALERGANDKARRGARHVVLVEVIEEAVG
jgi:hypothetical protein